MRTNQEIFNKVWAHFITDNNKVCKGLYKSEDGLVSACGLFIPDDLYRKAMEGNTIQTVLARWPKVEEAIGGDPDFLQALQDVHDAASIYGDYISPDHLMDLAEDFKLCVH